MSRLCAIRDCKLPAVFECQDRESFAVVVLCQRHADIIAPALRRWQRGFLRPIAGTIIAAIIAGVVVGLLFAIVPMERMFTTHPTYQEWKGSGR